MDTTKLKSRMSGKVQELQQPVEVAETAANTSLASADSAYIALTHNTLDIIRSNLECIISTVRPNIWTEKEDAP